MNTAITYKSVLGTSRQYAQWLSEEIKANTYMFSEMTRQIIADCDTVIIISGTYAGHMPLVDFLKTYWEDIKEKNVFAIGVGILSPNASQSKKSFDLISKEIQKKILYYKLPGKLLKAKSFGKPSKERLKSVINKIQSFETIRL